MTACASILHAVDRPVCYTLCCDIGLTLHGHLHPATLPVGWRIVKYYYVHTNHQKYFSLNFKISLSKQCLACPFGTPQVDTCESSVCAFLFNPTFILCCFVSVKHCVAVSRDYFIKVKHVWDSNKSRSCACTCLLECVGKSPDSHPAPHTPTSMG